MIGGCRRRAWIEVHENPLRVNDLKWQATREIIVGYGKHEEEFCESISKWKVGVEIRGNSCSEGKKNSRLRYQFSGYNEILSPYFKMTKIY